MPDLPPHLWLNYRLNEARRALDAQRPAEAETQLKAAEPMLAERPDQRVLFLTLGARAASERRDGGRALDLYLEAVRSAEASGASGPEVADAHAGAAQCLLLLARPAEAEPHLRRALESHPSDRTRAYVEERLRELLRPAAGAAAPSGARARAWSDEF